MDRQRIPTESEECIKLVRYLRLYKIPFTKIANETFTPYRGVKAKNKKEGVSSGFPDYVLFPRDPKKKGKRKTIYIEMKRTKRHNTSPSQLIWHEILRQTEAEMYVCYGYEDAKKTIEKSLSNKKHDEK